VHVEVRFGLTCPPEGRSKSSTCGTSATDEYPNTVTQCSPSPAAEGADAPDAAPQPNAAADGENGGGAPAAGGAAADAFGGAAADGRSKKDWSGGASPSTPAPEWSVAPRAPPTEADGT